ncbi:hypothetical protein J6590_072403 [Homalodisca vitripennis]|nr:hypothetical protein J6590_072403 [Homalodisca vitripennis]
MINKLTNYLIITIGKTGGKGGNANSLTVGGGMRLLMAAQSRNFLPLDYQVDKLPHHHDKQNGTWTNYLIITISKTGGKEGNANSFTVGGGMRLLMAAQSRNFLLITRWTNYLIITISKTGGKEGNANSLTVGGGMRLLMAAQYRNFFLIARWINYLIVTLGKTGGKEGNANSLTVGGGMRLLMAAQYRNFFLITRWINYLIITITKTGGKEGNANSFTVGGGMRLLMAAQYRNFLSHDYQVDNLPHHHDKQNERLTIYLTITISKTRGKDSNANSLTVGGVTRLSIVARRRTFIPHDHEADRLPSSSR